jgi:hypothetical protein
VVGLVPTLKRSYYRKKFHKLHKEILVELRKADHEKIDSRIDDLFDDYQLLLEHFSKEVKD